MVQDPSKRKYSLRKDMTKEALNKLEDAIKACTDEFEPYLNFLREAHFLDKKSLHNKRNVDNWFAGFYEFETVYGEADKWDRHQLKVKMLVPTKLDASKMVHFHTILHGGGLVSAPLLVDCSHTLTSSQTTGNLFAPWFPDYKRKWAIDSNTIILFPLHRLMPEDRGQDILDDIDDWWDFYLNDLFMKWVKSCLEGVRLGAALVVLQNLIISGESAGGLLAVYTWLTQSAKLSITAIYLQYPMLNHYRRDMPAGGATYMEHTITEERLRPLVDAMIKKSDEMRKAGRNASRSDATPPSGMAAAMGLSLLQLWKSVFQDGKGIMDTPERLEHMRKIEAKPAQFPPIYIIHGTKDTNVPIADTDAFVDTLTAMSKIWKEDIKIDYERVAKLGEKGTDGYSEEVAHAFDYGLELGKVDFIDRMTTAMNKLLKGITT